MCRSSTRVTLVVPYPVFPNLLLVFFALCINDGDTTSATFELLPAHIIIEDVFNLSDLGKSLRA